MSDPAGVRKRKRRDCIYEIVEEDTELKAVSGVFEELLENTDIRM